MKTYKIVLVFMLGITSLATFLVYIGEYIIRKGLGNLLIGIIAGIIFITMMMIDTDSKELTANPSRR